jgi:protein farnesyltransferase/geranylgeranyltransferase type-1 subunit alpha
MDMDTDSNSEQPRPRAVVIEEVLEELRQRPRPPPKAAGNGNTTTTNISYSNRPQWRGVRPCSPLPTDAAGGGVVVAIADRPADGGGGGGNNAEMRGLFRATALKQKERSARVRDLCADMVQRLNPADYTAWAVRWECVVAMASDGSSGSSSTPNVERALALLAEEDAFTRRVAREAGTKNYQLWNHRRKIAMASFGLDGAMPVVAAAASSSSSSSPPPPPQPALAAALARELSFADAALKGAEDDDHKNYHAWAHRQAALAACAGQMLRAKREARLAALAAAGGGSNSNDDASNDLAAIDAALWHPELLYCEAALRDDVRNNSAWAQRMFALLRGRAGGGGGLGGGGGGGGGNVIRFPSAASLLLTSDVVEREIGFVADALLRAPRNESAWSYLWGLLGGEAPPPAPSSSSLPCWPRKVHELCCAVLEDDPNCAPALDTLAGFYAALARAAAERSKSKGGDAAGATAARQAADNARAALRAAEVADPIRRNYWRWRVGEVEARSLIG